MYSFPLRLDQRLGGEAQLWAASTIEDDELALEEDVTKDGEANAGVGLDAAEAGCAACVGGGVVDI